jgi:hypothetical protein
MALHSHLKLQLSLHQALVLHPSCVPEKVGVNQKSINQK